MIRLSFQKISFVVVLFSTLSLSVTAKPLLSSEVAEFRAQLVNAQNVDESLRVRGECYSDKEANLQVHSKQLQETAGNLYRQKQILATELERADYEAKEFSHSFEEESAKNRELELQISSIKNKIRVKEIALEACKRQFNFLGFLCGFTWEIVGLNSNLRNLTADRKERESQLTSQRNRLDAAYNEKKQAEERLRKNRKESDKNKADITIVEDKIKVLNASLSEIRKLKQNYATLRDSFTVMLAELEGLDPASDRQSIVRRLRRESENLDALQTRVQERLSSNGLLLPGGERICAN
ncbi:coiled-coil domain-containing protein [Salmonella enterica subsp. enterica serovar Kokomlemle]